MARIVFESAKHQEDLVCWRKLGQQHFVIRLPRASTKGEGFHYVLVVKTLKTIFSFWALKKIIFTHLVITSIKRKLLCVGIKFRVHHYELFLSILWSSSLALFSEPEDSSIRSRSLESTTKMMRRFHYFNFKHLLVE